MSFSILSLPLYYMCTFMKRFQIYYTLDKSRFNSSIAIGKCVCLIFRCRAMQVRRLIFSFDFLKMLSSVRYVLSYDRSFYAAFNDAARYDTQTRKLGREMQGVGRG